MVTVKFPKTAGNQWAIYEAWWRVRDKRRQIKHEDTPRFKTGTFICQAGHLKNGLSAC